MAVQPTSKETRKSVQGYKSNSSIGSFKNNLLGQKCLKTDVWLGRLHKTCISISFLVDLSSFTKKKVINKEKS